MFNAYLLAALMSATSNSAATAPATPADPTRDAQAHTPRAGTLRASMLSEESGRLAMCFPSGLPQAEQDAIIARYRARNPIESRGGLRFDSDFTVWRDDGLQSSSGQAQRASLTYSWVPDGAFYDTDNNGVPLTSEMDARFRQAFGAGNEDRGRELLRQAFTSWRRVAGLNFREVADDGVDRFTNTNRVPTRGDIRVGGAVVSGVSFLANNYYPNGGSDMFINFNYWNASFLLGTFDNYRYLRNVVAHELGHGLAFGHTVPCNQTKLMEPFANAAFDVVQLDDIRGGQSNYGDRFSGNQSAATAVNFGNLNLPADRSVFERTLSTNGSGGAFNTGEDWFRFTLTSARSVTIRTTPRGQTFVAGPQSDSCNGTTQTINALQAGNLVLELRDANGVSVLASAPAAPSGSPETITMSNLAPGTYSIRVADVGPNAFNDQTVQVYDLEVRLPGTFAPPAAIAGIDKRCVAGQPCWFMGDINSYATEVGATITGFEWDFNGDGVYESPNAQDARRYISNGVYSATLRVTDSNLRTATDSINVTVTGATTSISNVTPAAIPARATTPFSITGVNFKGVLNASQVRLSGQGLSIIGTPIVNGDGTLITGLSVVATAGASLGAQQLTIDNSDGFGASATVLGLITIVGPAIPNDDCSSPISWGSALGLQTYNNQFATTGSTTNTSGTSCTGPVANDIWYTWTAPNSGNLTVTTTPTAILPRVAVYAGSSCPAPAAPTLGCTQGAASTTFPVNGGSTYLFQVGSVFSSQSGDGSVTLGLVATAAGACCVGGPQGCQLLSAAACSTLGRAFSGVGSTCNPSGNSRTPCCYADFNGIGGLSVTDIFDFLAAWFARGPGSDFNGDNSVSVNDIFDFLAAWFRGC